MDPITKELKDNWLKKENIELQQRRRRRYLHFDEVLMSISPSVLSKVTDPQFIQTYGFFPLIRRTEKVRIYKRGKIKVKSRPISYSAHLDALIYSWYAKQLETSYEEVIRKLPVNNSIIAYRSLGKSNILFAKEVFDFISLKDSCVAIALDITRFYDSLDFKILKKAWKQILGEVDLPPDHYQVYKSLTKFSFVEIEEIKKILKIGKGEHSRLKFFLNSTLLTLLRNNKALQINSICGIPQGTPISCILSNLYMLNFDIAVAKKVNALGGLYRRYSDDIVVVCPIEKELEMKEFLKNQIYEVNLTIEESKTEIRFFKKGRDNLLYCINERGEKAELQYLGIKFDGQKMALRHKGYAKFERRMVKSIKGEILRAKEKGFDLAKRKIYEKFTSFGKKNYISYAERAAAELSSTPIKKLISKARIFKKVKKRIEKYNI